MFTTLHTSRLALNQPIAYSKDYFEAYRGARLLDAGPAGMNLLADEPLLPETPLYICTGRQHAPGSDAEESRCYGAVVKWCQDLGGQGGLRYRVGVHCVIQGEMITDPRHRQTPCVCEWCTAEIQTPARVYRTPDRVLLCAACLQRLAFMPGSRLRRAIEDYLLGNVI